MCVSVNFLVCVCVCVCVAVCASVCRCDNTPPLFSNIRSRAMLFGRRMSSVLIVTANRPPHPPSGAHLTLLKHSLWVTGGLHSPSHTHTRTHTHTHTHTPCSPPLFISLCSSVSLT